MTPQIIRTLTELRQQSRRDGKRGESAPFVPTMGAASGSPELVRAGKEVCDRVIVTIFINPKQFNNPDDYKKLSPHRKKRTRGKLISLKADVVYVPDGRQMYPDGIYAGRPYPSMASPKVVRWRTGRHFDGVRPS